MKQPPSSDTWSREWTVHIGQAVRAARDARRLSAEQLSADCGKIGFPISRNSITNLENGRRESIPIHELAVLARALGVSPIDLLYPVGRADQIEVLPGVERDPYEASEWFSGEWPMLDEPGLLAGFGSFPSWERNCRDAAEEFVYRESARNLYRLHTRATDQAAETVDTLRRAEQALTDIRQDAVPPRWLSLAEDGWLAARGSAREELRNLYDTLASLRARMRRQGVVPPPLHGHLRVVDDRYWEDQPTLFDPPTEEQLDPKDSPQLPRQESE